MIDLIIPYYNNPEGLTRTLNSINRKVFYITIVDDNSTIYMPYNVKANQVLRYNSNQGPGFARQFGIERTHNEYIMFLDTGDIFTSLEAQKGILEIVNMNPQLDFIGFSYYHYEELTKENDNRLHGKVYKRSFLEKYNITFAPTSSYLNEDIGFNRSCRLYTDMKFISLPVIEQIKDEKSITNKENKVSLYRDQTRALSLVSIHTIENGIKNNINPQKEIDQIAIALYYWFIRTAAERPEFLSQAWDGAKIFYQKYQKEIKPNQLISGNSYLKRCLIYRSKIHFPINILRFTHEILTEKNLPSHYLT